jgi:hypothetical protein
VAQGEIVQRYAAADGLALAEEPPQGQGLLAPGRRRQADAEAAAFDLVALQRGLDAPEERRVLDGRRGHDHGKDRRLPLVAAAIARQPGRDALDGDDVAVIGAACRNLVAARAAAALQPRVLACMNRGAAGRARMAGRLRDLTVRLLRQRRREQRAEAAQQRLQVRTGDERGIAGAARVHQREHQSAAGAEGVACGEEDRAPVVFQAAVDHRAIALDSEGIERLGDQRVLVRAHRTRAEPEHVGSAIDHGEAMDPHGVECAQELLAEFLDAVRAGFRHQRDDGRNPYVRP